MIREGRGLLLLLNLDQTKRSIAGLKATSLRAVSTSSRIPWQTGRTYSWIIFSFSWSATALNLYNTDFTSVAVLRHRTFSSKVINSHKGCTCFSLLPEQW